MPGCLSILFLEIRVFSVFGRQFVNFFDHRGKNLHVQTPRAAVFSFDVPKLSTSLLDQSTQLLQEYIFKRQKQAGDCKVDFQLFLNFSFLGKTPENFKILKNPF